MAKELSFNERIDQRVKGRAAFEELWQFIREEIDKLSDAAYEAGREWLIKELFKRCPESPPEEDPTPSGLTPRQIEHLLRTPVPQTWRKHAGSTIGEVLRDDRQYLEWICSDDNLKSMIRELLRAGYGEPDEDAEDDDSDSD